MYVAVMRLHVSVFVMHVAVIMQHVAALHRSLVVWMATGGWQDLSSHFVKDTSLGTMWPRSQALKQKSKDFEV
jgi:hypothetical protein